MAFWQERPLLASMPAMASCTHAAAEATLRRHLDRLAGGDPELRAALERLGYPAPRVRQPGFATLLQIMTAQQLSTRAAAAIWGRLEAALAPAVTAERFLALDDPALRAIGFSQRKTAHARLLAQAIVAGELDLERLALGPDDVLIEAIRAQKGFGRWSAEIYLLFALQRMDVFPADDLALQIGLQRLRGLTSRPDPKAARALAEVWRPARGAAAIFLWHLDGAATLDAAPAPAPVTPAR